MLSQTTCDQCGNAMFKENKIINRAIKNNLHMFCSKECRYKYFSKKSIAYCDTCKKQIIIRASRLKRSKSGKVFCSRSCSNVHRNSLFTGEDHPNFKGIDYRSIALKECPNICKICDWAEDKRILEVHHIDGNRNNNVITNLIILCPNCHAKITRGYYKLTKENKLINLEEKEKQDSMFREELKQKIRTQTFSEIGKEFGVTDSAIRKWCKKYNLPHTKDKINSYEKEDWEKI